MLAWAGLVAALACEPGILFKFDPGTGSLNRVADSSPSTARPHVLIRDGAVVFEDGEMARKRASFTLPKSEAGLDGIEDSAGTPPVALIGYDHKPLPTRMTLIRLDPLAGRVRWTALLAHEWTFFSLCADDRDTVSVDERGRATLRDLGGRKRFSWNVGENRHARPSSCDIRDGSVVVAGDRLALFDAQTGRQRWTAENGGEQDPLIDSRFVHTVRIHVGPQSYVIRDARSGALVATFPISKVHGVSPASTLERDRDGAVVLRLSTCGLG